MHLQSSSFKNPHFDENDHSPSTYSTKPFFFHKYFCDGKSLKLRSSFHYSFHLISVEYIKSIGILSILEIDQDWVFTALLLSTDNIAKLTNKNSQHPPSSQLSSLSLVWLRNISFFWGDISFKSPDWFVKEMSGRSLPNSALLSFSYCCMTYQIIIQRDTEKTRKGGREGWFKIKKFNFSNEISWVVSV